MNKELTWRELKALNDLYVKRTSKAKIQEHPYISFLFYQKGYLDHKLGNTNTLIPTEKFDFFYEKNFKEHFAYYKQFLEEKGLETDARKSYTEEDIKTLILIDENRNELASKLTNIEDFSSKIFDYGGSKYLKNKKSLKDAVCKILHIPDFPASAQEHQWRLVLDCRNPKAVILCENKSFLKQPWLAREHNLKLWYVGGNNIKIIDNIDEIEFQRPIYYSGDWDLAGLQIFTRIKIKLQLREHDITLLYPNEPHNLLPVNSPYHKSKWIPGKELSGLPSQLFTQNEIVLIKSLIINDQWVEEESNDLLEMINNLI